MQLHTFRDMENHYVPYKCSEILPVHIEEYRPYTH